MTTPVAHNIPTTLEEAMALLRERNVMLSERDAMVSERDVMLSERDVMLSERDAIITKRDTVIAEQADALRACDAQIAELRAILAQRFAGSSERMKRMSDSDLLLFQDLIESEDAKSAAAFAADQADDAVPVAAHRRTRNGRRLIPDHLPRIRVVHELTEEERACPCCAEMRVEIGRDVKETLDFVPASVTVKRHERVKYACPECCGEVAIADPPLLPFDRSKAEAGMLAMVVVNKYADHLPLYRQNGIFRRFGIDLPRSTQCDWSRRVAETLEPLVALMRSRVRSSRVIQSDDTPVTMRDGPSPSRHVARFWSYRGDDAHPYVVYEFTRNRRGEHPQKWLRGFTGYLQCDAYAGYDAIFATGEVVEVACWAHARRKFHEARLSDPSRAQMMKNRIGVLYAVEKEIRELEREQIASGCARMTRHDIDAQRVEIRQRRARPAMDAIMSTLRAWEADVLPKSTLGAAVRYTLKLEKPLTRYLDVGFLQIDNNSCERSLRGIAVGRKNWLFAGSEEGGRTAAAIFSIIESARLHEIEPWAYMRDLLTRMPHAPASTLADFLPDAWIAANPDALLPVNR